jgi:hypothetical protein
MCAKGIVIKNPFHLAFKIDNAQGMTIKTKVNATESYAKPVHPIK